MQYTALVKRFAGVLLLCLVCGNAADRAGELNELFAEALRLRDAGDGPGALEKFRRLADRDPTFPFVHREIGLILLSQRDFASAADAFRAAVRHDADDFDSRYNLAVSLANAGRHEEGIAELHALLRRRPSWAPAFFGLGHIYARQKQNRQAEQAFRMAVRLEPDNYRAHFELGKVLEELGDTDGAVDSYQSAARLSPAATAPRYRLAVLLKQAGRLAEASNEFAAVRQLRERRANGERAAVAYTQALTLLERDEFAEAVRLLREAADLRPDFTEIRTALADAHEQWGLALESKGDIPGAIEQFRLAVATEPRAETHNHLGVLLANSGRLHEAISQFRDALVLNPDFRNAQVNLKQATDLARTPATSR